MLLKMIHGAGHCSESALELLWNRSGTALFSESESENQKRRREQREMDAVGHNNLMTIPQ